MYAPNSMLDSALLRLLLHFVTPADWLANRWTIRFNALWHTVIFHLQRIMHNISMAQCNCEYLQSGATAAKRNAGTTFRFLTCEACCNSSTFYLLSQNTTRKESKTTKTTRIYFIENMELSADVSAKRTLFFYFLAATEEHSQCAHTFGYVWVRNLCLDSKLHAFVFSKKPIYKS